MEKHTRRNEITKKGLRKLWHEFLFAREFEYETALTPDELATALKKLDKFRTKIDYLGSSSLSQYRMAYTSDSDKSGHFVIELKRMQRAEGSITANQETGLTIIRGYTRFNAPYYILLVLGFVFMIMSLSTQLEAYNHFFGLFAMIAAWWSMYHERNKLADHIDQVIMNAKSDASIAHLVDEDGSDQALEIEEVIQRESQS